MKRKKEEGKEGDQSKPWKRKRKDGGGIGVEEERGKKENDEQKM